MSRGLSQRLFQALTGRPGDLPCEDLPDEICARQPRNFVVHVVSLTATKAADGLIDPKLVLSWLLVHLGAPALFTGLLVPVREAGALLPQLFTAGALGRLPQRRWAWVGGSLVQGMCAALLALSAWRLEGRSAGVAIVASLAVLALARSVASVTYKDVLGRSVDRANRGTATGTASSAAAALTITFGALLASGLVPRYAMVVGGLGVAAALWAFAAASFATLTERPSASSAQESPLAAAWRQLGVLRRDPQLVRFISVRGLLISTALAPPFMVALGAQEQASAAAFGGLGLLVVASALAQLLSGYVWGRLADRSSRAVLIGAALAASVTLALTLGLYELGGLGSIWVLAGMLFGLMVAYQGVRIGRATHLVDMADTESRAAYTAVSNTIIGLLLLLGGGFGVLAEVAGEVVVIGVLAALSLAAVPLALGLEEVQESRQP